MPDQDVDNSSSRIPNRFRNFQPNTTLAINKKIADELEKKKREKKEEDNARQALKIPTDQSKEINTPKNNGSRLGSTPSTDNVWRAKPLSLDDLIRRELNNKRVIL